MHHAVCVDVRDLGIIRNEKYEKDEHKILISWQLKKTISEEIASGEGKSELAGKRYLVSRRFTLSLNEKSHLRFFLENWRNKQFGAAELAKGFDVESVIGANCMLQIMHSEDGKYANVVNVAPVSEDAEQLTAEDYTRAADREPAPAEKPAEPAPMASMAGATVDGVKIPF